MVTKVHIKIDSREWDWEMSGRSTSAQIAAAIHDITDAYPVYTSSSVIVVQHGWIYGHLAPIADAWLSVNPAIRYGLYAGAPAATALGAWLLR